MTPTATTAPVKVAVITGNHPFDVPGFTHLLRGLGELDLYIQDVENFAAAPQTVRDGYDVVLFYDYHIPTPGDAERTGPQVRAALERLGAVDQGVVVLHHALLSYPEWPVWQALTGLVRGEFKYYEGERVAVSIVDGDASHCGGAGAVDHDRRDVHSARAGAGQSAAAGHG